jgi:putative hydrolase of the HAD superfamily
LASQNVSSISLTAGVQPGARADNPANLARLTTPSPTRAVFLDALGTLVELDPPWMHLARALDLDPADERVRAAVRVEMAYYREHAHEGADAEALAALRRRCAELLSRELGQTVEVETMMSAIRFRAFADAAPALATLRARGLALVCVSNWDVSLAAVLESCGLAGALDGVVSSAGAGARKPEPAIFSAALELARCAPGEAIHVGDTEAEDVAGARAAGIACLLLDREGAGDISSLAEIEEHLRP